MFIRPTNSDTLLLYLLSNPKLIVKLPNKVSEYKFLSFAKGNIVFEKEDGEKTGEIPVDKMEFKSTHFLRRAGMRAARYYYTGPTPWVSEEEKLAEEWEVLFENIRY